MLFALPWLLCQVCEGQTAAVEARVTSVDGPALASGNSRPPRQLFRGELVLPGAEIDTRGGGTLTIGLSDGSVVVVEPGSRIVFKDYRSAASVRDLFNIFIGRVRVIINRVGGRPNPYRIDTPTASIAVRGTDFSVAVDSSGETLVVVYEGQVEVTSLIQPNQRFLVEPGRGVVVRVNQNIRYFTPVAGVAERQVEEKGEHSKEVAQSNPGSPGGRQEESPRNTAGTYQRFIASLVESDQTPFLLRFIAFPDSYLDSFQNPSYATEFHAAEGRAFVIPSLSGSQALEANSSKSSEEPGRPIDYSVSPQVSYFTPIAGGRTVLGGSVAASKSGLQASTPNRKPGTDEPCVRTGIGRHRNHSGLHREFLSYRLIRDCPPVRGGKPDQYWIRNRSGDRPRIAAKSDHAEEKGRHGVQRTCGIPFHRTGNAAESRYFKRHLREPQAWSVLPLWF